jgi:carboxymethylenebutenolidase
VRPGEDGEGTGLGVLVLSSWWGLTRGLKEYCNRLCDEGFVVLAPDLMAGAVPETAAEAELELAETDPNETANLILSSTVALRSATDDPTGPVAVIGFSMGASWALWAATRQPESFGKVVAYYGSQTIDFGDLSARVLGHFAEHDELVSADDVVLLEADLFEQGAEPEMWHYADTHHWFAEVGVDEHYDEVAAELAWERTLAFLRS